ncbi:DUF433 domain-containing protein [Candidatus Poribacteria bacterium]|nr:DUF433 domain-containing protein [Candidatus Poribacteria bacterium]
MTEIMNAQPTVIRRPDRGLSIAGTRITLYQIMDHIKAGYPLQYIQDVYDLTDKQIAEVYEYIETHREEVEAEYQLVLKQAEETERYWRERNREIHEKVANMPPKPGQEAIWVKLQAWKKN